MKFFLKQKNKGFMVVEILVGLSILALVILGFSNLAQKSISISNRSLNTLQATFLLEEGAEIVKTFRNESWSNVSSLSLNTNYYLSFDSVNDQFAFSTTASQINNFTRVITFQAVNRDSATDDIATTGDNDPSTRLVNISVSWQDKGETITKTMSFYISDIFS